VQSRYTISAPIAGVIQDLEVRNGMTVMNGQTMARINGLSSVWLEVAVPEAQADAVKVGNLAQVRLSAFPEQAIEGKVATILPMLNENSRSIKVRIELKNPQQQLRPGLSAQITLNSATTESGLAVPTEALIRTGKRTLVMLAGEQGRFTPKEISTGHEIGDQTLITDGLEEGQQVVSSGQFLIDSEASLNGIEAHAPMITEPPVMEQQSDMPMTEHKPAMEGAQ
jgi:Cu(I)/Ag(I) efflux system membrane fusion protein